MRELVELLLGGNAHAGLPVTAERIGFRRAPSLNEALSHNFLGRPGTMLPWNVLGGSMGPLPGVAPDIRGASRAQRSVREAVQAGAGAPLQWRLVLLVVAAIH